MHLKDSEIRKFIKVNLGEKKGESGRDRKIYGLLQIIQNLHRRIMDLEESTGLD